MQPPPPLCTPPCASFIITTRRQVFLWLRRRLHRLGREKEPAKNLVCNGAETAVKVELYHKVADDGYGLHYRLGILNFA